MGNSNFVISMLQWINAMDANDFDIKVRSSANRFILTEIYY